MKAGAQVVLINPPAPWLVNPTAQSPLGLLYVAGALEASTHVGSVRIVNMAGGRPAKLPEADIYGMTGTYLHAEQINALARQIRAGGVIEAAAQKRARRVVVGGPVALSPERLDMGVVDLVVRGEVDGNIEQVVDAAMWGGRMVLEAKGAPEDLDVAKPAWHLWPGPFGGDVFLGGRNYFGGGSATILTSRGCPFDCAFCAGAKLTSRAVRFRTAEAVVAEMEMLAMDYGVRQYRVSDDFFTCRREHQEAVCAEMRRSGILGGGEGCAWRASIGVKPNQREMFDSMRAAGCREVSVGIESADPDVLATLTRKGTPEDGRRALANAKAAGIRTRALMMVGLPGTTADTGWMDRDFIEAKDYDGLALTVFTPVPGCAVAERPEEFGCRIIPARQDRSLCMYGPKGRNPVLPTVLIEGLTDAELTREMSLTIEAAEATGLLGAG